MNDPAFDALLADAVGGELTDTDRIRFEQILQSSPELRRDYATALAAVEALNKLPGPKAMTLDQALVSHREFGIATRPTSRNTRARTPWRFFRFAASLLIAFSGGYALHAYVMTGTVPSAQPPTFETSGGQTPPAQTHTTLERAMADAYRRHPRRHALARCMSTIMPGRP